MLEPITILLAQPPDPPADPLPSQAIQTVQLPGAIAVIIATLGLLWLLKKYGQRLSFYRKFDNVIRLVVAILGIVGPATTLPLVNSIAQIVLDIINAFAQGAGWGTAAIIGYNAVVVILFVGGAYAYYSYEGRGRGPLLFLFLGTFFLFGLPWMQAATIWYINYIGVPIWAGLLFVFNFLIDRRITLS